MAMSKDKFVAHYEKTRCIPGTTTKKFLTTIGLYNEYEKYLRKEEKKSNSRETYSNIHSGKKCQVLHNIPVIFINDLKSRASFFINKLEAAHIIQRSVDISLTDERNNIVLINKYSHHLLDGYLDPIYGKYRLTPALRMELMRAFKTNNKKLVESILNSLYESKDG